MKNQLLLIIFSVLIGSNLSAQSLSYDWAKPLTGIALPRPAAITVDGLGNVYSVGSFEGTIDFDPGTAVFNMTSTSATSGDIFISKLDSNGNFVWAKQIGGSGSQDHIAHTIALDAAGDIVIGGAFVATVDFDPGSGVFNLSTNSGLYDAFICKLTSNGNFVWAVSLGDMGTEQLYGIAIDTNSNIYSTGYFYGTVDFDPGAGTFPITSAGLSDIFVWKLDAAGNFIWAKSMGGGSVEYGSDIGLDAAGNIYTTGYFNLTVDFDPSLATAYQTSLGGKSVFVSKLDNTGGYVWAKTFTGATASERIGEAIYVDPQGNSYTAGHFEGFTDFDPSVGMDTVTSNGFEDIFVAKLDPNGNHAWSITIGGVSDDIAYGISALSNGQIAFGGFYRYSADFDPGPGSYIQTSNGDRDIFISIIDTNSNFLESISIGDQYDDVLLALATNSNNQVFTLGRFGDTVDFNPGLGVNKLQPAFNNQYNMYAQKFTPCIPLGTVLNLTACDSFTSPISNLTWTSSGTYYDTLVSVNNCDSIITYNLSIINIDTSITQIGIQLQANLFGFAVSHQWVDCNNGYAAIPGAVNQNFIPTTNGNYAVIINYVNCVDTSNCYAINMVGIDDYQTNDILIVYPNPANDFIKIESKMTKVLSVEILDINGKVLLQSAETKDEIDVSRLAAGAYLLKIETSNGIGYQKLFKQ